MCVSIPDGDSFLREAALGSIAGSTVAVVSIPDGDSFLREAPLLWGVGVYRNVSIPDGDSFLREVAYECLARFIGDVSIPDGDSFLREADNSGLFTTTLAGFNPRWG